MQPLETVDMARRGLIGLLLMIVCYWSPVRAQSTDPDYPYELYEYEDPTLPPFVAEENVNLCSQFNYGAGGIGSGR